jgi:hypothetical protein
VWGWEREREEGSPGEGEKWPLVSLGREGGIHILYVCRKREFVFELSRSKSFSNSEAGTFPRVNKFLKRKALKISCRPSFLSSSLYPLHKMSTLAIYGGAGGLGRSLVTYFKSKGFVS